MRKIRISQTYRPTAVRIASFFASLAIVLGCTSSGHAQVPQALGQSLMSVGDNPIMSGQRFAELPTVDQSYSVLSEPSAIQPASYGGTVAGRQPIRRGLAAANYSVYNAPDPCNPGCDVSLYLNYEALWLRRENDERFSLSRNTFLPDFDYEFGGRYTVGQLMDCVNGWEAVYAGPFRWQRDALVTGAGNLQSQLVPTGGFVAADIDAFNGANSHYQS
ncbi:MAG: hypothetical protein R3C53_09635 [Pirellulaceae bacterium]